MLYDATGIRYLESSAFIETVPAEWWWVCYFLSGCTVRVLQDEKVVEMDTGVVR